jgi:hypothetical protein
VALFGIQGGIVRRMLVCFWRQFVESDTSLALESNFRPIGRIEKIKYA